MTPVSTAAPAMDPGTHRAAGPPPGRVRCDGYGNPAGKTGVKPGIHRTANPPGRDETGNPSHRRAALVPPGLRDRPSNAGAGHPGTNLTLRYQITDHRTVHKPSPYVRS